MIVRKLRGIKQLIPIPPFSLEEYRKLGWGVGSGELLAPPESKLTQRILDATVVIPAVKPFPIQRREEFL